MLRMTLLLLLMTGRYSEVLRGPSMHPGTKMQGEHPISIALSACLLRLHLGSL